MRSLGFYILGLVTTPVALTLAVMHQEFTGWLASRGWYAHWGVYDLKRDVETQFMPGVWHLDSWGWFHKGYWTTLDTRWVAFGPKQPIGLERCSHFGITVVKKSA